MIDISRDIELQSKHFFHKIRPFCILFYIFEVFFFRIYNELIINKSNINKIKINYFTSTMQCNIKNDRFT